MNNSPNMLEVKFQPIQTFCLMSILCWCQFFESVTLCLISIVCLLVRPLDQRSSLGSQQRSNHIFCFNLVLIKIDMEPTPFCFSTQGLSEVCHHSWRHRSTSKWRQKTTSFFNLVRKPQWQYFSVGTRPCMSKKFFGLIWTNNYDVIG